MLARLALIVTIGVVIALSVLALDEFDFDDDDNISVIGDPELRINFVPLDATRSTRQMAQRVRFLRCSAVRVAHCPANNSCTNVSL